MTAILKGNDNLKSEGSWVFSEQGVAEEQGFRNVSKHWYKETISYDEGLEQVAADKTKTNDIMATVGEMRPAVNDKGRFVLRYKDGREFAPTLHALGQIGNWADVGRWFPERLVTPTDKYTRDRQDSEALARVIANGFRRLPQDKEFLWRTRADNTLRAMLSDQYAVVNNEWFIESLKKIIPGGRLSHWRGDSDTLFGNVLIPDTIRAESDSDYGGMLSISNSEIGERKIDSLPSIFRAICMNGCIWGQEIGVGISKRHRGKIHLDSLYLMIEDNLKAQIPLLPTGIEKLLGTRLRRWDGDSVRPMFAQLAIENKLSKKCAQLIMDAYNEERRVTSESDRTLFGAVNAVTRAGQTLDNQAWVKFDEIGGTLVNYDENDWGMFTRRAKSLSVEEVDKALVSERN